MALGKPQKITRGPKTASTRSNSMSMTSLSQFPLLNHQTRKVQNSSLGAAGEWLVLSAFMKSEPASSEVRHARLSAVCRSWWRQNLLCSSKNIEGIERPAQHLPIAFDQAAATWFSAPTFSPNLE